VYFHAPGNPELHAPLGGGLEGWLGFKEVRGGVCVEGGECWCSNSGIDREPLCV
jgi:hypothetical protein